MNYLNDNFIEMTSTELEETTGGDIVAICTVVGCCIAGYALVREMVKDKGRRDGRGY